MKIFNFNISEKKLLIIIFVVLILLTFATKFYGLTDIRDYSDTSKFFAGKYFARIRSSHSYLFGFIHTPLVLITNSFIGFKITSLVFLFLVIYSVYMISNRDKKALWLMSLSPIIWYMAPWINPIQLASLLFLWAFYFMYKYDKTDRLKYLFYSGILLGFSWAIWDTMVVFIFFLGLSFLINKKLAHYFYFILFLFIGLSPRLILDQILFNFPFYTILKSTMGTISNIGGGIYPSSEGWTSKNFINFFCVFLAIPIYFWKFYNPLFFRKNKKTIIFLTLSLLIIFTNPQIRYTLIIIPIMILFLCKCLNEKQFKRLIILSCAIIFLFILPNIIQINYEIDNDIDGIKINYFLGNFFNLELDKTITKELIREDLNKITQEYPNKKFIVGNSPDDYQVLADIYWEDKIIEFVSIQDYELYLNNNLILLEKKFMPVPNINARRQIWISGGIKKNENDDTDYENLRLGIGIREPIDTKGFKKIKKYNILYLSEK